MAPNAFDSVNVLLEDKLFQVIGSTPRSIADSLKNVDFKGKTTEGTQLFAASIFAAAVNKSTLETFLADSRFANIRPLINAALSIQGRSNMTAMTLLGHCFLITDEASRVQFAVEFRKKMGQDHLWAGELTAGSLSDKQRGILKEKKRLTKPDEASALANGFLKLCGLKSGAMTELEEEFFGPQEAAAGTASGKRPMFGESSVPRPGTGRFSPDRAGTTRFRTTSTNVVDIPDDVLNYRRNVMGLSDAEIGASIEKNGLPAFIERTRMGISSDPDGSKMRTASTVGR